jgi:TusA-related sulfurtransferase
VLEVRVSDATAQDDIAAWCRLTGNELLSLASDVTGHTSYYLRKKLS